MTTATLLSDSLHTHNPSEPLLFAFDGDVVLCFQAPAGTGLALYKMHSAFTRESQVQSLIDDAAKSLQIDPHLLVVKIIGPEKKLNALRQLLGKMPRFKIEKWLVREDAFTLFNPENSPKLKLSTEEKVTATPIKVLIVDDSITIRKLLSGIIGQDPRFEIIGAIGNPLEVPAFIAKQRPDVITLDIHMPQKNGVDLLKEIFPKFHIPTLMISSISKEEGPLVFDALEAGAFDYIQKPSKGNLEDVKGRLLPALEAAARSHAKTQITRAKRSSLTQIPATKNYAPLDLARIVAIGASTGGTEALRQVLQRLPDKIPPIVIAQHIPAVFSDALAQRLNSLCPFTVKEAQHGELIAANTVYIAPGGTHMQVIQKGANLHIDIGTPEKHYIYSPSVDHLFLSIAKCMGKKAIGVILTGMGADGAAGMLVMRKEGAYTIGQDEDSCVVYGMPKEAFNRGAVMEQCSVEEIGPALCRALAQRKAS